MVIGVVAGAAVLALAFIIGVFKLMWRVAEPNEALIISGIKRGGGATAVAIALPSRAPSPSCHCSL